MKNIFAFIKNDNLRLFVISFVLFLIFIISLCSIALLNIIAVESNPFYYMNF
jgi:hypothetical protein